jgi:hypothetical protein
VHEADNRVNPAIFAVLLMVLQTRFIIGVRNDGPQFFGARVRFVFELAAALHEIGWLSVHYDLGGIKASADKVPVAVLLKDMDMGWIEVCLLDQIHRSRDRAEAKSIEINNWSRIVRTCHLGIPLDFSGKSVALDVW